jgi:cell division protein FtsB
MEILIFPFLGLIAVGAVLAFNRQSEWSSLQEEEQRLQKELSEIDAQVAQVNDEIANLQLDRSKGRAQRSTIASEAGIRRESDPAGSDSRNQPRGSKEGAGGAQS